jgi:hypothetical protein
MARPSISRAVVRLPASSSKNPARLEFPDDRTIALTESAYDEFLATFTPFSLPLSRGGTALVIPEKRGRGGRYWVARAYEHGAREAAYIGPSPDADALRRADVELSGRFAARLAAETIATIARFGGGSADPPADPPAAIVPDVEADDQPWRAWHAKEMATLQQMLSEIRDENQARGRQISATALGQLVDASIDLFLSYRDRAGLGEREAKRAAVQDVSGSV